MTNLLTPELTNGCSDFIKRYDVTLHTCLILNVFSIDHRHMKVVLDLIQEKKLIMDIHFVDLLQWRFLERHIL